MKRMNMKDMYKTKKIIERNVMKLACIELTPSFVALAMLIVTRNDFYLYMIIILFTINVFNLICFARTADKFLKCLDMYYDEYGDDEIDEDD
jgi:hypothetical protein